MFFNSVQYALFLPVVFFVYYMFPKKFRYLWLLGASYYFYMCWEAKYALLIFGVTVATYAGALLIEMFHEKKRDKAAKVVLALAVAVNMCLLFYFKYTNFLINNINRLADRLGRPGFSCLDIVLPVGISFFIFQAVGYTIDVYRQEIYAEKNFFRYALFISFFPQLVAGPIERSKNLLKQLAKPVELDGENLRSGLLYILYGVWQKVLIADNIAVIVNHVYTDYMNYTGMQIALATVLFGIEIYCDFGGYSNIAIGSARLLGIRLMQNFDSPYMALNVTEFWRRWHISLTTWFRDYLYIPLGGNRKGTLRKYINTLIVFSVSGAWHGASWNFIFWGFLNGLFIICENFKHTSLPSVRRAWGDCPKPGGNRGCISACGKVPKQTDAVEKWMKRMVTYLLVDFTWLFFRADSFSTALRMIKRGCSHPGLRQAVAGTDLALFGSSRMLLVILASVAILLVAGIINERGISVADAFFQQKEWFRWGVYIFFTAMIILYGAYGEGYEQTQFIYFQF